MVELRPAAAATLCPMPLGPLPFALYVGLPYVAVGPISRAAAGTGAPALLSAGAMYRRGALASMGSLPWRMGAALDSAGFTAMRLGGYRWSIDQYVEWVVTNGGQGEMPFPWSFWSAMDYCVEKEIAGTRAIVEERMDKTIGAYVETLEALQGWREEGVNDVPDPMPILQGSTIADYLSSAERMAEAIDEHHPCSCPTDPDECTAEWHRGTEGGLPELVGIGSVCRRHLHGEEGLIALLDALDRELPERVRLHLFGVKGQALQHLGRWRGRIASADSMAWDYRARRTAKEQGIPFSTAHRAEELIRWHQGQKARLQAGWQTYARLSATAEHMALHPPPGTSQGDVEAFVASRWTELWELSAQQS